MFRHLLNLLRGKKSNTKVRRKLSLTVEALEDRMVPASISWHGGAIIPNVQVESVYYGAAWINSSDANNPQLNQQAKDLNYFFVDITQSAYMSGLSQYTGLGYNQQITAPGTGQFLGADMVNTPLAAGTTLTDGQIRTMLQREIIQNNLDKPDANKLYFVMLPPGVRSDVDYDAVKNTNNGGGYHWDFAMNGVQVHYAVIESSLSTAGDLRPGFSAEGEATGQETKFEHLTYVASHELSEAVTDPDVGLGWTGSYRDSTGNLVTDNRAEIGDITQGVSASSARAFVDGYEVQKYFTPSGASIAAGSVDYSAMTQVPTTLNGAQFTLTPLQQGSKPTAQLQFSYVATSTTSGQSNFDGYWLDTDGKFENIVGTLQVSAGRRLNVVVKRASDQTVLFVGTLSTPNGDWRSGIEISPEKTGPTGDSRFFGVENDGLPHRNRASRGG